MEQEKLFHPCVDVLYADGSDRDALEMAMVMLHDIGWITQQCGIESAVRRLESWHEKMPELFMRGCAHGSAALHCLLGRTKQAP